MKILVVTPTFLPVVGGAELGIYEIYNRLGKHHDIRILTPEFPQKIISRQGVKDKYFSKKNLKVRRFKDRFNLAKMRGQRILGRLIPPLSISYIWPVFSQIKKFHPDVINFHYVVPGGLSLIMVKKLTKIPIVLSLISRADVLKNINPYFKKHPSYFSAILKSVSCIAPISPYYSGEILKNIPTKIIPYGVDTKRFSPGISGEKNKNRLKIDKNKIILFTLQRLVKVKRIDILIKSLEYILKTNKNVLLVIGGKGPEENSLKDLAKKIGLYDNIMFAGYIPEKDLPKYFAMSDIFVFSSINETFGIIFPQAMASGKPIVAINSTAIPKVVDNGLNGTLVGSLKPKQFAKAVVKLMNDKNLMKKYSQNGRKKAVEKYDWDIIAQQYEQVFQNLIKRKK